MPSDPPTSPEHAPLPDYRHAKARKWRLTIAAAGLVLASAFFMPAVSGCNEPIVPVETFSEFLAATPFDPEGILVGACMFVAAYLLGLLMAAGAVARLLRRSRVHRAIVLAIAAATVLCCLVSIIYLWPGIRDEVLGSPASLVGLFVAILLCIGVPAISLIYLVLTARLRECAGLCRMFIACVVAVVWFGYWQIGLVVSGDRGYYGLNLSFAASVVLLVAVVGESRVMAALTWRRTIWLLLTGRLRERPDWRGRCPGCEYLLFGLSEMRCPECGRAFTWPEVGLATTSHSPARACDVIQVSEPRP